MTSIRCILVNYRTPPEMLRRCLASITGSAGASSAVTIVDNASGEDTLDDIGTEFPQVQLIRSNRNLGFAAAVNLALAGTGEEMVLLLNTDAVLRPEALARMAAALEAAGRGCAGVAPKMMSSAHPGIIDAAGTVMPRHGAPFNRGIGQCDLGQYDLSEEVAGICFGAALIRRELFDAAKVGLLYEGYFLYFEDSDWCMRATSQGYFFLTAPDAIVDHVHSGVIRNEPLDFKYKLVELNTLKIVIRTFASRRRVAAIVASRCARLLARTFIRRRYVAANLATLAEFTRSLPRLLRERRALRTLRVTGDSHVFRLAEGEDAYFDTVGYKPHRCLESLIATYERLLGQNEPSAGKILAALYGLRQEAAGGGPLPQEKYAKLLADAPPCVKQLLDCAAGESSAATP